MVGRAGQVRISDFVGMKKGIKSGMVLPILERMECCVGKFWQIIEG